MAKLRDLYSICWYSFLQIVLTLKLSSQALVDKCFSAGEAGLFWVVDGTQLVLLGENSSFHLTIILSKITTTQDNMG